MGMDVDAVGMTARSLMHRKAEMRVSFRRNDRVAAGTKRLRRKSNDVNEEMDRLQPDGTQQTRSGQVEIQSIDEIMD
eukprot:3739553-Lingulodinium_polyedra.AAC.1